MLPLLSSFGFAALIAAASPRTAPPTLEASPQTSATGGTTLDLGSNQHLHIDPTGAIRLDAELLVLGNIGLDPSAHVLSHRLQRDRLTVALGIQIPHTRQPDSVVLAEIDLLSDHLVWSALVHPPTLTHEQGNSWSVVFGDRITLVQRDHLVVAIDMRTGTQAWSFGNADPTFAEDYSGELEIERGGITIERVRVRGRDVLIDGKRRDTTQPLHVDLDLLTGRRVDPRKPAAPTPLFAFADRPPPFVHDGPAPHPPAAPKGFDGIVIGYTTLLWNTTTARGIIVNPTADALEEIITLANQQHVADPGGSTRPVQWVLAIDTGNLASEMIVGKVPQPKHGPRKPTIWLDYDDGLDESGEVVDADALAAALDIPALRSRVDLRDVPADVRVSQREFGELEIAFGPVGFREDTQRWAENHVTRP